MAPLPPVHQPPAWRPFMRNGAGARLPSRVAPTGHCGSSGGTSPHPFSPLSRGLPAAVSASVSIQGWVRCSIQSLCQVFSSRRFHHISELTPLTPSPTLVRKGRKETCGEGDLGNGLFCFLGVPMPFCLLLSAHILLHSPGNRCLSNPGFQPRRKPTNTLRHYKSVS